MTTDQSATVPNEHRALASVLRYLRVNRTQAHVARRAAISVSTYSLFEQARTWPTPEVRGRLAEAFGIETGELESLIAMAWLREIVTSSVPRYQALDAPEDTKPAPGADEHEDFVHSLSQVVRGLVGLAGWLLPRLQPVANDTHEPPEREPAP